MPAVPSLQRGRATPAEGIEYSDRPAGRKDVQHGADEWRDDVAGYEWTPFKRTLGALGFSFVEVPSSTRSSAELISAGIVDFCVTRISEKAVGRGQPSPGVDRPVASKHETVSQQGREIVRARCRGTMPFSAVTAAC